MIRTNFKKKQQQSFQPLETKSSHAWETLLNDYFKEKENVVRIQQIFDAKNQIEGFIVWWPVSQLELI